MPVVQPTRRGGPANKPLAIPPRPFSLEPLEQRTLLSASAEFVPVNNTAALTGYTTADLEVTTTADWTSAAFLLELTQGSIYQDANGDITAPNPAQFGTFPTLRFDTYLDADGSSVFVAGGAIDAGGDTFAFSTTEIDALWFNLQTNDTGTLTIGRFTLTDDAVGTWSLRVLNADGDAFTDNGAFTQGNLATPAPFATADELDLTGDTNADILWRNFVSGKNTVWQMNGLAFQTASAIKKLHNVDWDLVAVADFTGDGNNDLLWRNTADGRNVLWEMNGPAFQFGINLKSLPNQSWRIIGVGDFTGDGWNDILWRNVANGKNSVWQMLGTTFQTSIAIKRLNNFDWQPVGVSDFTSDAKPDILWRNTVNGANTLWQMNNTTFQTGVALKALPNLKWNAAAVGDFTGDGNPDILWRHRNNGRNTVWQMNGTTFQSATAIKRLANTDWQTGAQAANSAAALQTLSFQTHSHPNHNSPYTPPALTDQDNPPLGLWEPDDA